MLIVALLLAIVGCAPALEQGCELVYEDCRWDGECHYCPASEHIAAEWECSDGWSRTGASQLDENVAICHCYPQMTQCEGVYAADDAWLMCLWALSGYRGLALRLASPRLRPLAGRVIAAASALRGAGGYGAECADACT